MLSVSPSFFTHVYSLQYHVPKCWTISTITAMMILQESKISYVLIDRSPSLKISCQIGRRYMDIRYNPPSPHKPHRYGSSSSFRSLKPPVSDVFFFQVYTYLVTCYFQPQQLGELVWCEPASFVLSRLLTDS